MRRRTDLVLTVAVAFFAAAASSMPMVAAQGAGPAALAQAGRAGSGRAMAPVPAPDPTKPVKLSIATGSKARYRVREQLAGISFPSDAVGTTETVTGVIVLSPNGSIDVNRSKLTVDLRTLASDQQMRDGYIQSRTLETDKFPMIDFVPKRLIGLAGALPATGQAGFQLVGDMTMHGITAEATWNVVATFSNDQVAGRATTAVQFGTFKLTKPSLARLLSVDDKIELEIEFRLQRSAL